MVIKRGEIWWADLADPLGSAPGYRRPVLVLQSDLFNQSKLPTTIVAALSSNLKLAAAPGNVLLSKKKTGLPKDSVLNVSQVLSLDKSFLTKKVTKLPKKDLLSIESGLKTILELA